MRQARLPTQTMQDIGGWENELRGAITSTPSKPLTSLTLLTTDPPSEVITHITPEDLEQEELEAYAEDYTLKDVEDLDGIDWSLTIPIFSPMSTKSVHLLI